MRLRDVRIGKRVKYVAHHGYGMVVALVTPLGVNANGGLVECRVDKVILKPDVVWLGPRVTARANKLHPMWWSTKEFALGLAVAVGVAFVLIPQRRLDLFAAFVLGALIDMFFQAIR